MQDKKVIILIVLLIFAVMSIVYGIMTPSKYKRTAGPSVSTAQSPVDTSLAGNAAMKRKAKRTRFKSWKRNPFVSASSASPTALVLNGIIWSKEKPRAMIGDMIVTEGDKIGEVRIVDIKPNKVILNDGTKEFELKMEK